MGTDAPTTTLIPVFCAPKKAPCPRCGKHGTCKRRLTRTVRTVAYKAIAYLEITYGEYETSRSCPPPLRRCLCLAPAEASAFERLKAIALSQVGEGDRFTVSPAV